MSIRRIAQLMNIIAESHPPDPKRRPLQATPQKVRESKRLLEQQDHHESDNDSMNEDPYTHEQELVFSPPNISCWNHDDAPPLQRPCSTTPHTPTTHDSITHRHGITQPKPRPHKPNHTRSSTHRRLPRRK